jgi:uncharacterized protein YhaN
VKINEVKVDGFGVWSGLRLEDLHDRITVFYGANEAGKTTLLQFIRAVLYGMSSERRQRYLDLAPAGVSGGALRVSAPSGEFVLTRRADPIQPDGVLQIVSDDGRAHTEQALSTLLADVDESTFNNVFAVGLTELQELGSLSDTDAARWLYSLTSGLDRVSLVEVLRELRRARDGMAASDGRESQVSRLLAERRKLQAEIETLSEDARRWPRLLAARAELESQIARSENETARQCKEAQTLEAALAVQDSWRKRENLDAEFAALGIQGELGDDGADRLLELNELLEQRQENRVKLRERMRRIREQARELPINEGLCRNGPRIEALGEQQYWVASIEEDIRQLEEQRSRLRETWSAEAATLGLGGSDGQEPLDVDARTIAALRAPARELRDTKERYLRAKQEAARTRVTAGSLDSEIKTTLAGRSEADLAQALEETGQRVARLRRRIQLDERLVQMEEDQRDMEEESLELLDGQILPIWIQGALCGAFALGVVLIFAQLILPGTAVASFGWTLVMAGLGGLAVVGATKYWLERSAAQRLEDCHSQLDLVQKQIAKAKEERKELDESIPAGGGPLASRLKTAEDELAQLEQILPDDSRRKSARDEALAAEQKLKHEEHEYEFAQEAWREALVSLGLPNTLTPKQIQLLSGRSRESTELRRRIGDLDEQLTRRRRDYDAVSHRVSRLYADVEIEPLSSGLVDRIRELQAQIAGQEKLFTQRNKMRRRYREWKRKERRYAKSIADLKSRRRTLLRNAGVTSEEEYQWLAARQDEARKLRSQRAALSREIAVALGRHTSEEELSACLAASDGRLEQRWEAIGAQVEAGEAQLKRWRERLGELTHEQKLLAEDRRLDERRLDLAVVEQRLRDVVDVWRVRCVTALLLETIRNEYERHKQPETLVEASGHLKRLTEGRYTRVWTPLGEEVLYVEDAGGKSRSVDMLSRGTREQLFLSLRLALVALYSRRGAALPLVLDDVLVNFDADRAQAAARVLRDFAKQGHQLLVFTCHEHVWKMFKSMRLDVRRLPVAAELEAPVIVEEVEPEPEPIPEPVIVEETVVEKPVAEEDEEWEEEEAEAEDEYEDEEEDEVEDDDEEYEYEEEEDDEDEGDEEEVDELEEEEDEYEEDDEYEEEVDEEEPTKDSTGARGWEVEFEDEWDDDAEAA